MRASFISAGLMAALVVVASPVVLSRTAAAADLYGENYSEAPPPDYYDDDPAPPADRYDRKHYSEAPPPDRYDNRYDESDRRPVDPPPGSIKDGYPVPMPPPARYGEEPPPRRVERFACLDRWQIKRELRRSGWTDLRPLGGDGRVVHALARRFDSSTSFRLRVDRCSGEVLAARPEFLRTFAYRDREPYWPERRWDRYRY
jgi:hypothetical protein